MINPVAVFFEEYKLASGEGAVVELKLRLLADKVPSLQRFAHAQKLEDIENEIARYFGQALSEQEKNTLALCRQLRNKILHCNFSVARETLVKLGKVPQSSGVRRVDLAGLNGAQMLAKTKAAMAGDQGTFENVSVSATTSPGNVFGWLLEIGQGGDLPKAVQAFRDAAGIIDRLAIAST